jgi:hypothetical protein
MSKYPMAIEPSPYQNELNELHELARQLIEVIELEKSGVRDGKGFWENSDRLEFALGEVKTLGAKLLQLRAGELDRLVISDADFPSTH